MAEKPYKACVFVCEGNEDWCNDPCVLSSWSATIPTKCMFDMPEDFCEWYEIDDAEVKEFGKCLFDSAVVVAKVGRQ